MKFLLDVNVGSTIAFALQAAGHDVVRTVFLAPRALDPQILAWAVAEQRVLVTYDSDFTDFIFRDREPQPPAIIYVRDDPIDLTNLAARIVAMVGSGFLLGHIHVIGEVEIRHRKFPGE